MLGATTILRLASYNLIASLRASVYSYDLVAKVISNSYIGKVHLSKENQTTEDGY